MDSDFGREAPNERCRFGLDGHQSRHRLPVFRDDDALRPETVENREALLFELCSSDRAHGSSITVDRILSTHEARRRPRHRPAGADPAGAVCVLYLAGS